jgi:hypothetical protein
VLAKSRNKQNEREQQKHKFNPMIVYAFYFRDVPLLIYSGSIANDDEVLSQSPFACSPRMLVLVILLLLSTPLYNCLSLVDDVQSMSIHQSVPFDMSVTAGVSAIRLVSEKPLAWCTVKAERTAIDVFVGYVQYFERQSFRIWEDRGCLGFRTRFPHFEKLTNVQQVYNSFN